MSSPLSFPRQAAVAVASPTLACAASGSAAQRRWPRWCDLRLAHKMTVVFGGLLCGGALAAAAMLAFWQTLEQRTAQAVQAHDARLARSQQWLGWTQQAMEAALASVLSSEEELVHSFGAKAQQYLAQAQQVLPALALAPAQAAPAEGALAAWAQLEATRTAFLTHYAAAYRARDLGQAWEVARIRQAQLEPAMQAYQAAQRDWMQVLAQARQQAVAHAAQQRARAQWMAMAVLGGLLLVAAAAAVAITRAMTRPLVQAVAMAQAIAQGDLRGPAAGAAVLGRDEVGHLLQAFAAMSAQLQHVVGGVRDGVAGVSATAHTVAQGNADLAQRTQHSAEHLAHAVQHLEQLRDSVSTSAVHAGQAHDLAAAVAHRAQTGADVVQQVVQRMGQLRTHSAQIASITGLIDTIAFQTNILALNAAVEAARAGAQGRGFAVVASEVRELAQRSAQAAQQIKALVDTSLQQVTDSAQWAGQAGEHMAGIVQQVHSVSDRVGHITAAAQAQREGIAELHAAMQDLNAATQANARQVHTSSAAARTLHAQAHQLAAQVAVFALEDVPAAALPASKLRA